MTSVEAVPCSQSRKSLPQGKVRMRQASHSDWSCSPSSDTHTCTTTMWNSIAKKQSPCNWMEMWKGLKLMDVNNQENLSNGHFLRHWGLFVSLPPEKLSELLSLWRVNRTQQKTTTCKCKTLTTPEKNKLQRQQHGIYKWGRYRSTFIPLHLSSFFPLPWTGTMNPWWGGHLVWWVLWTLWPPQNTLS